MPRLTFVSKAAWRLALLVPILTSCGPPPAPVEAGKDKLDRSGAGNGDFSYEEVDYRSVLPGLDIVRVNPMLTEREDIWLMSAHNSGWFWDFETRMSNPWNVGASTTTLKHLGRIAILRNPTSVTYGNNGNAQNYARGLFYNLSFVPPYGRAARLDDLVDGSTTTFQSVLGSWDNGGQFERLASRTSRDGNTIVYEYDGVESFCSNIRIRHVASGASVYVARTGTNGASLCLPTEITLPDGVSKIVYHWTSLETDSNGLGGRMELSQVTYPDGTTKKYTYKRLDSSGMSGLTSVIDQENRPEKTFIWDGEKVISSFSGPADNPQSKISVVQNADGSRTVTDAEGIARTVVFKEWTNAAGVQMRRLGGVSSPCAWCESDDKSIEYNDVGLITKTVNQQGVVTSYTPRFSNGTLYNVTTKVEGVGTPEAKTYTTTWDERFNLPTKTITTDASGDSLTVELDYDAKGRITRMRSAQFVRALDGSTPTLTKTTFIAYTNHANGQVATVTVDGPRADVDDVLISTYAPEGVLLSVRDAAGTTRYSNFSALGYPQTITHPNGVTTALTYDWAGRVTSSNTAGVVTKSSYYKNGLLKTTTTPGTDETVTFEYDAANRLKTMTDRLGNRREYTYDALGRPVLMREGDINKQVVTLSISAQYANGGRTVTQFPTGTSNRFVTEFDGTFEVSKVTNPMLQSTSMTRDAFGRLRSTQNNASALSTTRTFDLTDNVKQTTYFGPEGSVRRRQFQYTSEASGAVWETLNADTGSALRLRDLGENPTDVSDNTGSNRFRNTFDGLNRVQTTTISSPTGTVLATMNYVYDTNPDNSLPAPTGWLTQIGGTFGSVKYFYDVHGNITKKAQTHATTSASDAYTYDGANRLTSLTYPSGRVVKFTRDAVGRPSALTTKANTSAAWRLVADDIQYYPFTDVTDAKEMRLGGTLPAKRLRDTTGQVTAFSTGTDDDLVGIQRRADGLIARLLIGSSAIATYDYDASNRIKAVSGSGLTSQSFVFESTGDLKTLTSGTVKSLSYATNSSKLTALGSTPVILDARGAVTSIGDLNLTYDARGYIATAQKGNGTKYSYTYDALGRRQSKTPAGAAPTHYHYDVGGHLLAEFNPSTGETFREYIWLGERPLAVVIPAKGTTPEKLYFIFTDYSNTPIRVTETNGTTVWSWFRNPFGSNLPSVDALTFNLRMPGQYYDAETGLHYSDNRYYHPETGRYLQPDPQSEEAGISAYTYADGDPVNEVDPTGLSPESTIYNHVLGNAITVTPGGSFSGGGPLAGFGFSMEGWVGGGDDPYYGPKTDFTPGTERNDISSMHGKHGLESVYPIENTVFALIGRVIAVARAAAASAGLARQTPKVIGTPASATSASPKSLMSRQGPGEMSRSQVDKIAKSIRKKGYDESKPIDVIETADGKLVIKDGHHRAAAASKAGLSEVPINRLKVDRATQDKFAREAEQAAVERLYGH